MLRLLARAIFGASTRTRGDPWARIIEAAIDKAVDGTDPRLRALYGYKSKLRKPVTRAVHFANELGERFPPPVELGRARFATDPRALAFFSSVERLQEVISTSVDVQAFVQVPGNRTLDRLHAVLAMTRSERTVLAPALRGDRIRQEVERTLVSFDGHRVVLPSRDEAGLRRQIKERAFTTLVECALERMAGRRERKKALEAQRALLRAKLRAIKSSRSGLDSLSGPASSRARSAAFERKLNETERALRDSAASSDSLERNLADLCTTLERPGDFISLQAISLRLTRMNYLLRDGDAEPGDAVEFMQVDIPGRASVCGVLVCYPIPEIRPGRFYSDRMRRALDAGR
jgi:hypothetical protein